LVLPAYQFLRLPGVAVGSGAFAFCVFTGSFFFSAGLSSAAYPEWAIAKAAKKAIKDLLNFIEFSD